MQALAVACVQPLTWHSVWITCEWVVVLYKLQQQLLHRQLTHSAPGCRLAGQDLLGQVRLNSLTPGDDSYICLPALALKGVVPLSCLELARHGHGSHVSNLGAGHKVVQLPIDCPLRYSLHSPGVARGLQAYDHTLSICERSLHRVPSMLTARPKGLIQAHRSQPWQDRFDNLPTPAC